MADTNSGPGGSFSGDTNKKQSGLSWSQPPMPNQSAQSKPMSSPSGLGATPTAMQKPVTPVQPMKSSTPMRTSQPHSGSGGKIVGGFIAGLVIGALITTIWFTSAGSTAATTSNTSTTTAVTDTTGTQTTAGNTATGASMLPSSSLSVASPQDAGMQVVVNSATVSVPTWLLVYDSSSNGQPVRILGASMFFPENNGKGTSIPLLRATQSGQTYTIGERIDDGDHKLSFTLDKLVVDSSGNAMRSTFTTR